MTSLTPAEQLYLEQINRARMNPLGEANGMDLSRDIDLNVDERITADPKQPLAPNEKLTQVARTHLANIWATSEYQSSANKVDPHNFDGTPASRIAAAGYAQNNIGRYHNENFGSAWNTAPFAADDKLLESMIKLNHSGLFTDNPAQYGPGAGHRQAMMDPDMKEVGIAEKHGTLSSGKNAAAVIENFGVTGTQSFLTGVVYNDTRGAVVNGKDVGDHFYSLGEAVQNVNVSVKSGATAIGSDVTGSGGGWSVGEPATAGALYTVTFSGAGLAAPVSAIVDPGSLNAKVDLVNGKEINSSANTTLSTGASDLRLLGISNINGTGNAGNNIITGNAGNNILTGAGGNDNIDGQGGTDTVVLSGKQADYKITVNGGTATLEDLRGNAPDGTDTISNVEFVKFADATLAYGSLKTTTAPAPIAGSVVISDAVITEGASGSKVMIFTVTRSGGTAAFDVNYATSDGSATVADGDYLTAKGAVHFNSDDVQKTIAVTVNGDAKLEANETFKVTLSGANNGAVLADSVGVGTITNDDANRAPTVTGSNVSVGAKGAISVSSIFVGHDADGDASITKYAFWDGGNGGGYFTVNGVAQASGQWITVNVADLATVKYVGGVNGGAETLYATAYDGTAWQSGYTSITATTLNRAAEDFNGDGNSDILFHNAKTGSVAMWQQDGMKTLANVTAGSQATSWHAIDTFDFSGDGKADILWQNDNGKVQLWQMDGSKVAQVQDLGSMTTGWHVGAVDDFSGDGKAEVLWFNDNGQVQMWNMNGAAHTTTNVGSIGAGWSIKDSADFNGDGKADLLLQKGNQVAMWQMDGGTITKSTTFATIGDNFHFAGTGDFNGDGRSDIVWHNDANGQVVLWELNGSNILSNTTAGWTAAGWDIADVGDYNHDGHADLLLRNASGALAEWQMDGDHILANQGIGSVSTDWHLI